MDAFKAIRDQTSWLVHAAADIPMIPRSSPLRSHNIFQAHADWVSSIAFSPNHTHIATASGDGTLLIWNLKTATHINLGGHTGFVRSVSFSPDGHTIATGGYDSRVCIWDLSSHTLLSQLSAEHDSRTVSFSPDGRQLASVGDWSVKIWNVISPHTPHLLASLDGTGQHTVAYAPDSSMLACGSGKSIAIWFPKYKIVHELLGHTDTVLSVVFTPVAPHLISGSRDGTIRRWNTNTRESIGEPLIGHIGSVLFVSISPNGEFIASSGQDKTLRLWNAITGHSIGQGFQHPDWVRCVKFSPNGKYLASACDDKKVRLWQVHLRSRTLGVGLERDMSMSLGDSVSEMDDEPSEHDESEIWTIPTTVPTIVSPMSTPDTRVVVEQAPSKVPAPPRVVPNPVAASSLLLLQRDKNGGKSRKKLSAWLVKVVFRRFRGGKGKGGGRHWLSSEVVM